eukprot:scaffold7475_cov174-Amphora_coffeaeformis.AAC.2
MSVACRLSPSTRRRRRRNQQIGTCQQCGHDHGGRRHFGIRGIGQQVRGRYRGRVRITCERSSSGTIPLQPIGQFVQTLGPRWRGYRVHLGGFPQFQQAKCLIGLAQHGRPSFGDLSIVLGMNLVASDIQPSEVLIRSQGLTQGLHTGPTQGIVLQG